MTDSQAANIPSTFNGKPTEYHLFDGYKEAGAGGKPLYVIGGLLGFGAILPLAIPVYMDYRASEDAKKYAREARESMAKEAALARSTVRSTQPAVDMTPDLNNTQFRDALQAQKASGQSKAI